MSGDTQYNPGSSQAAKDPDEIELKQILLLLWQRRFWIVACTLVFAISGAVYSLLVTPQYFSSATIALKDPNKGGGSGIFSQLGGFGGAVAAQLGAGGTDVTRMTIILGSEDLALSVIKTNDLLPVIYEKLWDSARADWKSPDPKKKPSLRKAATALREGILVVAAEEKKGIIRIGARHRDPKQAKRIVDGYLLEINRRIRNNVTADADSNRNYLERQLYNTTDPVMIEKIQSLIAGEIEKAMLMSSSSFEVLEPAVEPLERVYPKRKNMVVMAFGAGLVLSVISIFLWIGFVALRGVLADSSRSDLRLTRK